jgi:hypothetical protein
LAVAQISISNIDAKTQQGKNVLTTTPPDPLGFAYTHFGRLVAPDAPADWLRKPAAQRKSLGAGGGAIIISASKVVVLGAADYTEFGLDAPIRDSAEKSRVMADLLFNEPREPWLAVKFTKAGVPAAQLHLNLPGDAICAYYDGSVKRLVSVRHAQLRRIGDALLARGVRSGRVAEFLMLGRDAVAQLIEPASPAQKRYDKAREVVPALPMLAQQMVEADLDAALVKNYVAHQEAHHA